MQPQALTYQQNSRGFLRKVREELPEDLPQACEKTWGAAAEIVKAVSVKAVSEETGWPHKTHRSLYQNVNTLVRETGDQQLRRFFAIASDLHVNFYENWYDRSIVEAGISDVERFVEKVEGLLSP